MAARAAAASAAVAMGRFKLKPYDEVHHETITTTALVLSIYEHLELVEPRTVRQLVAVPGLAS